MKEHKIGARVRVNCPGTSKHGRECVVTGPLKLWRGLGLNGENYYGQEVDIPHYVCGWHAFEYHELTPIYDGHEKTSWSECEWKPNQITAC